MDRVHRGACRRRDDCLRKSDLDAQELAEGSEIRLHLLGYILKDALVTSPTRIKLAEAIGRVTSNMLRFALSVFVTLQCLTGYLCHADTSEVREALQTNQVVAWAGLDYSRMLFTGTSTQIRVPELLFQNMPEKWNDLFLDERVEGMAERLDKLIKLETHAVAAGNAAIARDQVRFERSTSKTLAEPHISAEAIQQMVMDYSLQATNGIGLVFIVDRLVAVSVPKKQRGKITVPEHTIGAAAIWVVWFDVASRKVVSSRRETRNVMTGGSFRNYWFGPIKEVDEDIGDYR